MKYQTNSSDLGLCSAGCSKNHVCRAVHLKLNNTGHSVRFGGWKNRIRSRILINLVLLDIKKHAFNCRRPVFLPNKMFFKRGMNVTSNTILIMKNKAVISFL